MKKNILVAFLLVVSTIYAQGSLSISTSVVDSARYEIIQSPLESSFTFKLDKFSGHIFQLVRTKLREMHWEDMLVKDLHTIELDEILYPRFQIFMGVMGTADTYLLDTKTGVVWQLQKGSDGSWVWNMME